jgi:hypothetical protein
MPRTLVLIVATRPTHLSQAVQFARLSQGAKDLGHVTLMALKRLHYRRFGGGKVRQSL